MKGTPKNRLKLLNANDVKNLSIKPFSNQFTSQSTRNQQKRRKRHQQKTIEVPQDFSSVQDIEHHTDSIINNQYLKFDACIEIQQQNMKKNFESQLTLSQKFEKIENITIPSGRKSNKLNQLTNVALVTQRKSLFVRQYKIFVSNRNQQQIKILEPSFYIAASVQLRTIGFQNFLAFFLPSFPTAKIGTGSQIREEILDKIQFQGFEQDEECNIQPVLQIKGKELLLHNLNVLLTIFGSQATEFFRYLNLMKWQNAQQQPLPLYLNDALPGNLILQMVNSALMRIKIK